MSRPHSAPTVDARIAGFRDALLEAHGTFVPEMVVRLDPADAAAVQSAVKRFRPDAIVCADIGKMAIAVMANRLRNPGLPAQDVLLDFRLVVRRSSGVNGSNGSKSG